MESWDITVEAPYVRKRPRRKARKEGAGGETLRRIDCSFCHQERITGKQDQGLSGDDKAGRVPSGVCIYIPGYVYIPFPEIGYVKGMYLIEKVCKTAFTAMFPG